MNQRTLKWMRLALAVLATGTVYQVGGCTASGIGHFIGQFNPCGTILNCDPIQYRFVRSGYVGPGADPSVDLFCTYPPYCGDQTVDPQSPIPAPTTT